MSSFSTVVKQAHFHTQHKISLRLFNADLCLFIAYDITIV